MSFWARLKFLFGIVFVLLLVGLLILYLNSQMSTVRAAHAELGADTTTIGSAYAGLLTQQRVAEGDKVKKGETLFVLDSPELTQAINNHSVQTSTLPFTVDPQTNNIVLKAADDGVVEKTNYQTGSFVPAGTVIATIDTAGSLYISGHFHLSPPDYARVKKGNIMDVVFPDNSRASAKVYSIALAQTGDVVDTVVKARMQDGKIGDFRFPVGTPVEASLKLSQHTWVQNVTDFLRKLFKPSAQ